MSARGDKKQETENDGSWYRRQVFPEVVSSFVLQKDELVITSP